MATTIRVLLLAPDPALQRRVQLALDDDDVVVAAAAHLRDAERMLAIENPSVVVVDARRERELELLSRRAHGGTPMVALVDEGSRGAARVALERGAADVVSCDLLEETLLHRLRACLPAQKPSEAPGAPQVLARAGRRKSDLLVGRSRSMVELMQRIDMIAKSDIGAAIYGDTGTGKELVARTIHARSKRAGKPFVAANCTALPEPLFENELFGHERGAFTGADTRGVGLIGEAEGGTLLLDEIGDISGSVQAKLLRLLQFHEYKMIGGAKTLRADVRILTTTNRDLTRAVREGRFREDLYYRMNTLQITLPPLRERLEDVPLLVDHFVQLFNEREQRDFVGFTPAAIKCLATHGWPGNVRELESVVYRSLVMAGSRRVIDVDDVQLGEASAPIEDASRPFAELKAGAMDRFERRYLEDLLVRVEGNLSHAARLAQHERKSLWRLLQKHGLDPAAFRDRSKSKAPSKSGR
jgi:two-component system response regulator GlrR